MKPARLPHDPLLPQLARVLDPQAMGKVFESLIGPLQVLACEVERVKYRPRRNCSVSYRLLLNDPLRDRDFEQRVAARFFGPGESLHRHRQAARRGKLVSAAGPGLSHCPELEMLAHWAPNDAKLDALRLLDDPQAMAGCLDEVVAVIGGERLVGHSLELVQHVPELRVCARVELSLSHATSGRTSLRQVYVKADLERLGGETHAVMRALSGSPLQARGRLLTPTSLLWQPETGLHWQEAIAGRTLHEVDPKIGPAFSARVGECLAALHATPVPCTQQSGMESASRRLRQAQTVLGQVDPAWRAQLDRIAALLDDAIGALAGEPGMTLHGDLHPRNILVQGERLGFVDLDSVHRGPAVLELGGWVADAIYRGVVDGVPAVQVEASWRSFLAGYARASGHTPDARLLASITAHQLICRRACGCVSTLKPGRYAAVPRLLAWAESIAGTASLDAGLGLASATLEAAA